MAAGLLQQNEACVCVCVCISRCARCVLKQRSRRETWVHSLARLYLLRYVKTDASIIQSTALRRFPDVWHSFTWMCARRGNIYIRPMRTVQARALSLQDISGCLQGRPCGISRDTDVTSKVTRCLDTFRNMRGRISFFLAISFRMSEGRDTCSPSSRCIKNVLAPFYINDTSPRVQL